MYVNNNNSDSSNSNLSDENHRQYDDLLIFYSERSHDASPNLRRMEDFELKRSRCSNPVAATLSMLSSPHSHLHNQVDSFIMEVDPVKRQYYQNFMLHSFSPILESSEKDQLINTGNSNDNDENKGFTSRRIIKTLHHPTPIKIDHK